MARRPFGCEFLGQKAGQGHKVQVMSGTIAVWAGLTIASNRGDDKTRKLLPQFGYWYTESFQYTWAKLFDQNIGVLQ